jgi:tetratricopeptide (TPR) repeat protein
MIIFRFSILVIFVFVAGNFFTGCAAPVYKAPPKSPDAVYDYHPEKSGSLPHDHIEKTPVPPITQPGHSPDQQRRFPPRIGSDDFQTDSQSHDKYLLAAVTSLEIQSENLLAQGLTEQAFATAERAIRFDPANAKLWNLLARIQLRRGNFTQAEELSKKSNLLAKNDKQLQAENWRIIAQALAGSGYDSEAEKAFGKARELENH